LHFHDLRHTGNTLAASDGTSLRDLMDRMGHDSVRSALIYQHATTQTGRRIADSISAMIQRAEADDQGDEPKR
jgi:integrase